MREVVYPAKASATPFYLVQHRQLLIINTKCCKAEVKIEDEFGSSTERGDVRCRGCNKVLATNPSGWLPVLNFEKHWWMAENTPDSWHNWGEFWFGVENFEMEVKR